MVPGRRLWRLQPADAQKPMAAFPGSPSTHTPPAGGPAHAHDSGPGPDSDHSAWLARHREATPAGPKPCLEALAFHALAQKLTRAPHRLGLFPGALFRWLLVIPTEFHFPENALALHLLFQRAQVLIDVVVSNQNLHGFSF